MQIMVIEYARSCLGLKDANSTEFEPEAKNPVVSLLEEQVDIKAYGGTMRLGRSDTHLKPGSRIHAAYGAEVISERHRHRYEVSNQYRKGAGGGGSDRERAHPGLHAGGIGGMAGSSVGSRRAVPPRVQVEAPRPQPAVLAVHHGMPGSAGKDSVRPGVNRRLRAAALVVPLLRPGRAPGSLQHRLQGSDGGRAGAQRHPDTVAVGLLHRVHKDGRLSLRAGGGAR